MFIFAMLVASFGADVVSIWGGARGTLVKKSDGTVWSWVVSGDSRDFSGAGITAYALCAGS